MLWVFEYSYFSVVQYLFPHFRANSLNDTLKVPRPRVGTVPRHPQGVPNTVSSPCRRRQLPVPWAVPSLRQKGARICKIGPQVALILRLKRLPKRIFFVKVASLKSLCEKKARHSGEGRKRRVPGFHRTKRLWRGLGLKISQWTTQGVLTWSLTATPFLLKRLPNPLKWSLRTRKLTIKPLRRHPPRSCESPGKRAVPGPGEETFRSLTSGVRAPPGGLPVTHGNSLWPRSIC